MTRLKTTGTTSLTGEQLTDAIRQEHAAVSAAAQSALQHALEAGRLLADARRNISHGSWESYVRDSCGIPPRTASLYLRLHRNRDRLPNRQHVADLSVRQAARLLEQPKVKTEPVHGDPTKAEYWAAKINAAWAGAIDHMEADVEDIAASLSDDSMPPKERRKRDRLLRERAGELAEMKAAQARARTKSTEPSPLELQMVAAHAEAEHMRAKTIATCAETDYLLSVLRSLSKTLPEDEQQSVAAFADDLAEKLVGVRRKVERPQGASA